MAKLQPKQRPAPVAVGRQHGGFTRYYLDKTRLLKFFGGERRVRELAHVYGLPDLDDGTGNRRADGSLGVKLTLNNVLLLLELGERMHRPLDLYQFLCEER